MEYNFSWILWLRINITNEAQEEIRILFYIMSFKTIKLIFLYPRQKMDSESDGLLQEASYS